VKPLEANPFPEIERLAGMLDLSQLLPIPFLYDRFLYLPAIGLFVLYAVTTIYYSLQMQAQSPSTDPNQKMMSNMMMPLFIYFGLIFPNGLLLYFVVSNIVQMVQQAMGPKVKPKTDGDAGTAVVTEVIPPKGPKGHKVAKSIRKDAEVVDVVPE